MYFKHLLENSPSRNAANGKRKTPCDWVSVEGPLPENLWEKSIHVETLSNGISTFHIRKLGEGMYIQEFVGKWIFRPCIKIKDV